MIPPSSATKGHGPEVNERNQLSFGHASSTDPTTVKVTFSFTGELRIALALWHGGSTKHV